MPNPKDNIINMSDSGNAITEKVEAKPKKKAAKVPLGKNDIEAAINTLEEYKKGKANLDKRIVENEQWYKLRHWEQMNKNDDGQVEPSSAWLFNCIANKHADAMDNFPEPNILPREEGDKEEAKRLTSIIPVILEQNDFEDVYSKVWNYKLKSGTGVYGVFWDSTKLNGLGDISIQKIDLLNLFWEPGISDIQKSKNLFHVELADNDVLVSMYPQLNGRLGEAKISVEKYIYDDSVDVNNKSAVVDWYYHKMNAEGRTILHYCKFVNDEILFSTENTPEFAENGFYDHGLYPFVFDPLFEVEGSPAGFGYIDVGKSAQEYIDRGNQAILMNMLANAKPRFFVREDGNINEQEFADTNRSIVHVAGNLSADSVMPITATGLSGIYVSIINNKIDELKETTGNRDVNTGGSASGITAASAIAAMQEAGSKLSRDHNKSAYRVFRQICNLCIELIRQFYDMPRFFRITGDNNSMQFVEYSNANIVPQPQGNDFGVDMGMRLPVFDIEITAQKKSPYTKMAQNELALQFYGAGFFNPQTSDQALACLDMMDFDRKESIMEKIAMNGTMYQQIQQMQEQLMMLGAMVDSLKGNKNNEVTSNLARQFGMQIQGTPNASDDIGMPNTDMTGGEAPTTAKARERVAESTVPR